MTLERRGPNRSAELGQVRSMQSGGVAMSSIDVNATSSDHVGIRRPGWYTRQACCVERTRHSLGAKGRAPARSGSKENAPVPCAAAPVTVHSDSQRKSR